MLPSCCGRSGRRWQQQRPGITGKPVRLAEAPLLAGREDSLSELNARLTGRDGSRTLALTGFGCTWSGHYRPMFSKVRLTVAAFTVALPGAGRKSICPEPAQGTVMLVGMGTAR